jgi:pimeloyl-ACP methyl ester carboxylesterase
MIYPAYRFMPLLALVASLTSPSFAQSNVGPMAAADVSPSTAIKSGYAPVDGLQVYYEIYGQGKPVIVLHGGITATEGMMGDIRQWAKTRQVIALHAQGHGNTADIDRPYRYESLGDDVAATAKYLKLGKVDLVGYSFGGGIALQTAIRHPELVDRLVVISAPMKRDGFYPEVVETFEQMRKKAPMLAGSLQVSPLAAMYPKTNWEASFRKMGDLQSTNFDWTAQIEAIRIPTLLIFADADAIRVDHIAAFYKALGGGQRDAGLDGSLRSAAQLAIVPNATHYSIVSNPAVASIVDTFLYDHRQPE